MIPAFKIRGLHEADSCHCLTSGQQSTHTRLPLGSSFQFIASVLKPLRLSVRSSTQKRPAEKETNRAITATGNATDHGHSARRHVGHNKWTLKDSEKVTINFVRAVESTASTSRQPRQTCQTCGRCYNRSSDGKGGNRFTDSVASKKQTKT